MSRLFTTLTGIQRTSLTTVPRLSTLHTLTTPHLSTIRSRSFNRHLHHHYNTHHKNRIYNIPYCRARNTPKRERDIVDGYVSLVSEAVAVFGAGFLTFFGLYGLLAMHAVPRAEMGAWLWKAQREGENAEVEEW